MAITTEEQRLQGIAQLMVHENLLDKTKALECQTQAHQNKQTLLQYLVQNHILSAQQVALIVAQNFGLPFIDLDSVDPEVLPVSLVNEKLIRRHTILPLFTRGNHLSWPRMILANKPLSKKFNFIPVFIPTQLLSKAIS